MDQPLVNHRFRAPMLAMVIAFIVGIFLIAPGGFAAKAHAVLHGLCAQRPSHTFSLGGQPLPFDARMTGIYGAFFLTSAYLIARGRTRAVLLPPRTVLAALLLAVVLMGIDGVNAFLFDISAPTLYLPDNRIRLVTGLFFGITLATLLWFLFATTFWSSGLKREPIIHGFAELLLIVVLTIPFAAVVLLGWGVAYIPITILLMTSALTVVTLLVFCSWLLFTGRDRHYPTLIAAQRPLSLSMIAAVAFLLGIASARFWLEQQFGLRTLG